MIRNLVRKFGIDAAKIAQPAMANPTKKIVVLKIRTP